MNDESPLVTTGLADGVLTITLDAPHTGNALDLAMTEALSQRDADGFSVLDQARKYGVTVVGSASILQSKLSYGLPPVVVERLKGFATDAQRAIQFSRSTPGITVALTGMGREEHVRENLGLAGVAPATVEEYFAWFQ